MRILYRITSIASSNPSPIYQEDKNKLNELCLRSFLHAFSDIDLEIIFLADHCTFQDKIKELCRGMDYKIIDSNVGQNQTMLDSYRLACEVDDYVLFNECDHFYLPNSGPIILEAIKELGLVSAYDHPDFYSRFDIHPRETEIVISGNHHFRKSARNVMSWGCHSSLIKENRDLLDREGYLDGPVWEGLREKGHQLYTAIPALSTHMVRDYLSPSVNWMELWI